MEKVKEPQLSNINEFRDKFSPLHRFVHEIACTFKSICTGFHKSDYRKHTIQVVASADADSAFTARVHKKNGTVQVDIAMKRYSYNATLFFIVWAFINRESPDIATNDKVTLDICRSYEDIVMVKLIDEVKMILMKSPEKINIDRCAAMDLYLEPKEPEQKIMDNFKAGSVESWDDGGYSLGESYRSNN